MTKKTVIIALIIISTLVFAILVYQGLWHARGVPTVDKEKAPVVVQAPFVNKTIDLSKGISEEVWNSLPARNIELTYQLMALPWGKSLVSPISVKTFHNKKDIYFYISWKDATEDAVIGRNRFSDASAILFPMNENPQPSTLMMGFLGKANIWQWKASQDRAFWHNEQPQEKAARYADFHYPFEDKEVLSVSKVIPRSAVNDLVAIRVGTIAPKETHRVEGRGLYNNGAWHTVFRRALAQQDPDYDAKFTRGKKRLCAFAVWNGSQGDRGGRKSISNWVELEVE